MTKLLIIRLSSIGDIVLTTPVIRCLKKQLRDVEIHYLIKKAYTPVLQSNPYVDKIHLFKDNYQELIPKLKEEKFDEIIDLHKNFRSYYIRWKLKVKGTSFPKLNLQKWLITRFRINILPRIHIVDRYFHAVSHLGVMNDRQGLDYFLLESERVDIPKMFPDLTGPFIAMVIGGKHATKIFPAHKAAVVCDQLSLPVILLGGKEDMERGEEIAGQSTNRVINAAGKLPLNGSASVLEQSERVITNDTGLMHMAAALRKPITSIWGNTIPEFGMTPYYPLGMEDRSKIVEVKGLRCRPCSKLGYDACPERHFDCMEKIPVEQVGK